MASFCNVLILLVAVLAVTHVYCASEQQQRQKDSAGSNSRNNQGILSNVTISAEPQIPGVDILEIFKSGDTHNGVTIVPGPLPHTYAWRIRPSIGRLTVPENELAWLRSRLTDSFSVYASAKQIKRGSGTLFTIGNSSTPWLTITSSLRTNRMKFRYRLLGETEKVQELVLQSPFENYSNFSHMLLVVEGSDVTLYVNCEEVTKATLSGNVDLTTMPRDVEIFIAQDNRAKNKFSGWLHELSIYPVALHMTPWSCTQEGVVKKMSDIELAELRDDPLTASAGVNFLHTTSFSVGNQGSARITAGNAGIPIITNDEKIVTLEATVLQLSTMVEMLKSKAAVMEQRLAYLESCECRRQPCQHEGRQYREGQTWNSGPCTQCICQSGETVCRVDASLPQCQDPCLLNPCGTGGICVRDTQELSSYNCECMPGTTGDQCQHKINVCFYMSAYGDCFDLDNRYFYNYNTQACEQFIYSGCGGNRNNFATLQECRNSCLEGACCYRTYVRQMQDGTSLSHDVLLPGIECQELYQGACRALGELSSIADERYEVVAFHPGKTCKEASCNPQTGCRVGARKYTFGELFTTNCQQCRCLPTGSVECRCVEMTTRKEIRDMTKEELERFQSAVAQLRLSGPNNAWEQARDLYMCHIMEAHNPNSYLTWHRTFLRELGRQLQEIDCSIALPYFDFTTDITNFTHAIIWQPNYYGGDGSGSCVEDHPFRTDKAWDPCIIRRFDNTAQLPSKLDVATAMASNDYQTFSDCIQTIMGHVFSYIGGHIVSSGGPYDPLFYALQSYVDMLFWRWQQKPINRNKLPEFTRTVPLMPFNIRPMDVLNSESQICVTYALQSLGDPCNDTGTEFNRGGFDVRGYDRNGFDRRGYTADGYDKNGFTANGVRDTRDLYPHDGYNFEGYNREGYDRRGYSRYGYYVNGYNRDGYDVYGYNRHGFDRYGYDSEGYDGRGYDRNGYDRSSSRDQSGYYGSTGFNYLCLDQKGYNSEGFDIYGFNSGRQDGQYCNYTYNGLHIPRVTYRLDDILFIQRKDFLMSIPRTCLPPGALSALWFEQIWSVEQKPLPDRSIAPSSFLTSTWSSRFCFDVETFITSCHCDQDPAVCTRNPCNVGCSRYPDAVCYISTCGYCTAKWYRDGLPVNCGALNGSTCSDGRREYQDGSSWRPDVCTECGCRSGVVSCTLLECPTLTCDFPAQTPGECCKTCNNCEYNDNFIFNGGEIAATDPCSTCRCLGGNVQCQRSPCPPVRCRHPRVPKDGCCPLCSAVIGCEYEGQRMRNGGQFQQDTCTTCTCNSGNVDCVETRCPTLNCDRQFTPMEECCPRCLTAGNCEYEGMPFNDGQFFTPMSNPCLRCSCMRGIVRCNPTRCEEPQCANPVQLLGACCAECPDPNVCVYNGQPYSDRERWISDDQCQECACYAGEHQCRDLQPCRQTCEHGFTPEGQCCPVCTDCLYEGRMSRNGAAFPSNDGCDVCRCNFGTVTCQNEPCRPLPCRETEQAPGQCCPICKGCVDRDGERYEHQQRFHPTYDVCKDCQCSEGTVTCTMITCTASCVHPIIRPEECCPLCDGCFYQGFEYASGSVIDARDPCQECLCRQGTVDCRATRCPRPTCPNPVTDVGQCCPVCDQCVYEGETYQSGEEFMSPRDPCERCRCLGGEVSCSPLNIRCNTQCSHPYQTEDQCCPVCDQCEFNQRRIKNGQQFRHPTDMCQICTCTDGSIDCGVENCITPRCRNPITESGQCCPTCPDVSCYSDGQEYEEGQTWDSPSNPCMVCTCNNRQVRCERRECPTLPCTHPARSQNTCCPQCGDCEYDRRYFYNGQTFGNPLNQCEGCLCREGSIVCDPVECPRVTCSEPITDPGECCPTCLPPPSCTFDGVTHQNGVTWDDPRQQCKECLCRDGNAECGLTKFCSPANCIHPRTDGCCDSCEDGCTYEGEHKNNGDYFKDPRDNCRECSCQEGYVVCSRVSCPRLDNCDLIIPPTFPDCCATCTPENRICQYNRRTYNHGQEWPDESLPCTSCRCTNGEIECGLSQNCERALCPHPRTDGCCPDCTTGCTYEGLHLDNRSGFPDPRDTCRTCECFDGSVICRDTECPRLSCGRPVREPGECCPICPPEECLYAGKIYPVSSQRFDSPITACQECECRSDLNVECYNKQCPVARCQHPFKGECCNTCDDCTYLEMNYVNNVEFADPDDSCQLCTCTNGNVRCGPLPCEPLTCPHRRTPPNACCPICIDIDCLFNGLTYPHSQYFEHPMDSCQECLCEDGAIDCNVRPCLTPQCPYPIQTECCESCDGCSYNGEDFASGESFADPFDPCQKCECQGGYVQCYDSICPSSDCSHPIKRSGDCCPTCDGCLYERRPYGNGDTFPDASDRCQTCTCLNGNVTCASSTCQPVNCPHPTVDACGCPSCGGCQYNGDEYPDGSQFPDTQDPCRECMCRHGSVECRLSECPQPRCFNPVTSSDGCCPVCDGCAYNDNIYNNGQTFPDTVDACRVCTCLNGNVNCGSKICPRVSCTHGMPDDCLCPSCDGCMYEDVMVRNGETFIDPSDMCRDCLCLQGSVSCIPRSCPPTPCENPIRLPGECCATCPRVCKEREPNMCEDCVCINGEWECVLRDCPPANCPNPGQGMCCMECNGCTYGGKPWGNRDSFPDPADVCRTCECNFGFVSCRDPECPRVNCRNPIIPAGQCCPLCIGQCTVDGVQYENGETYRRQDDPCTTCTCKNGQIFCQAAECSRLCSHPQQRPGECCPVCVGCEFDGLEIVNNGVFIHPSNPCHNCVCRMGNVECSELRCQPTTCPSPVTIPGECCPACPECRFDDRIYPDGSRWLLPSDKCQQCECQINKVVCNRIPCPNSDCTHPVTGSCCPICDSCLFEERIYNSGEVFRPDNCRECSCLLGNVMCVTQECPELTCDRKVRDPGQCCERCQGCLYQGFEYSSGESWISPLNPCINCQCQEGDTLCTEIRCLTPDFCSNPIYYPDQCCPVCPGCEYDGVIYSDDERFQPRGNPCESCLCQSGNLLCLRESCESLLNCPSDSIQPPVPGECCATCRAAELTRGCTNETTGLTTKPYNDPCFTCECKRESLWECTRDMCPMMSCPRHEQITLPGECCPHCQVCHVETTGRTYFDGQVWTQGADNCISCVCDKGAVSCEVQTCETLVCDIGFELYKPDDKCCYECRSMGEPCVYQGQTYLPNEQWMRDECTSCVCHSSQVHCTTQRCAPLQCEADEVPTQDPGNCCPRCVARPATCIAFGDPHYRTFDGKLIHFQGTCRYIMTMDCKSQDFIVEVTNDPRNSAGDVSWTHEISVIIEGNQVNLGQEGTVTVDGEVVSLPYLLQPYFLVEERGGSYFVNTNIGVKVLWDGKSYVEVSVPGSYARETCGMCGNFNSYPQDDLKLRNGQLANSDADFGNSWKVDGIDGTNCDAQDIDPCNSAGYQARKMANIKCSVLKSPRFVQCHESVPPEPYFASCVYDMCACGSNDACLCDALAAYAAECRQVGVVLSWRTTSLCAINCPSDRGFMFDECGPACPRTCANKDIPDRVRSQQCLKPCIPGCNCPANKVLYENQCIDMDACPSDFRAANSIVDVGPHG